MNFCFTKRRGKNNAGSIWCKACVLKCTQVYVPKQMKLIIIQQKAKGLIFVSICQSNLRENNLRFHTSATTSPDDSETKKNRKKLEEMDVFTV